ncbi:MAG: hypothetical protein QOG59_2076 [Solirubrobacteraceae bacterium]|jgi:hypothetical protein|nr:hypothetical protein [Solirubrobacteraceae bacterium]
MRRKLGRPSPTTIIALVALGLAIGGTASASSVGGTTANAKSTFVRVKGSSAIGNSGDIISSEANCPAGYTAFSGGYVLDGVGVEPFVSGRAKATAGTGWLVKAVIPPANPLAGMPNQEVTIQAYAYCVKIGHPLVITAGQ